MYQPKRSGGGGGWKGGKSFGNKKPWERNSGGRDFNKPAMHPATCSECGSRCEVPFKPNGSRPIFCSQCFKRDEYPEPRSFNDKPSFKATCAKCGNGCDVPFRPNGSKPVYCRDCFGHERGSETKSFDRNSESKTTEQFREQFKAINFKLDAILKALAPVIPTDVSLDEAAIDAVKAPKKLAKEKKKKKKE